MDRLIGDRRQVRTNAPPYVEVVVNRRGSDTYVHLCNQGVGRVLEGLNQYTDDVVEARDITMNVALPAKPKSVTTVPEGKPLPWRYVDGRLYITDLLRFRYYLGVRCEM